MHPLTLEQASERARIAANNAAAGVDLPGWLKNLLPGGVIPTIPPLPALNISNNISDCVRLKKGTNMKCTCLADYSGGNCTAKRSMTVSQQGTLQLRKHTLSHLRALQGFYGVDRSLQLNSQSFSAPQLCKSPRGLQGIQLV